MLKHYARASQASRKMKYATEKTMTAMVRWITAIWIVPTILPVVQTVAAAIPVVLPIPIAKMDFIAALQLVCAYPSRKTAASVAEMISIQMAPTNVRANTVKTIFAAYLVIAVSRLLTVLPLIKKDGNVIVPKPARER